MVSASKITLAASQAHWTSFLSHACCLPALCEIGFSREDTSGLRRVRAEAVMSPRLGLGLWSHQAAAGGGMGAPLPAAIWGQSEPGPSPALTLPSRGTGLQRHSLFAVSQAFRPAPPWPLAPLGAPRLEGSVSHLCVVCSLPSSETQIKCYPLREHL